MVNKIGLNSMVPRGKNVNQQWTVFVQACKKFHIGSGKQVKNIIGRANQKHGSKFELFFLPVYENINYEPQLKIDDLIMDGARFKAIVSAATNSPGPVISEVLKKIPQDVALGRSSQYLVCQVRLDEKASYEHTQGITTLLALILAVKDKSVIHYYLFADDPDSHTNWKMIKNKAE